MDRLAFPTKVDTTGGRKCDSAIRIGMGDENRLRRQKTNEPRVAP